MEQDTLDGMPTRLFPCTPTKLVTWSDCPRRFRFTYLDRKPKAGPWAHNSVGLSIHNALRDWFTADPSRRTLDYAAERVVSGWIDEGFRDDAQSREWRDSAVDMTVEYVRGQDVDADPIGLERTVSKATHSMALSGRVDRIDLIAVQTDAALFLYGGPDSVVAVQMVPRERVPLLGRLRDVQQRRKHHSPVRLESPAGRVGPGGSCSRE